MSSDHKQDKKIELHIVVNGTAVEVKANLDQTLRDVLAPALHEAGVPGNPDPERWEFNFNGHVLDQQKKIREFGFPEDAQIFLNMKAGVAG
jgi:hypothetical protein